MIRTLLFVFACCLAPPAFAQGQAPPPDPERAIRALAAVWRPIAAAELASPGAAEAACAGAIEEIAALEAMLPAELTPENLARVRALHGLVVIPAGDEPGTAFFFPPPGLPWFASGLGVIVVRDEAQGRLDLRDASGANIGLQLGHAGGRPVLRAWPAEGTISVFVGCAPTAAA